jgi:hypothetical protein
MADIIPCIQINNRNMDICVISYDTDFYRERINYTKDREQGM